MFSQLSGIYPIQNPEYVEANRRGEIKPEQVEFLGGTVATVFGLFRSGSGITGLFVLSSLCLFSTTAMLGLGIKPLITAAVFGSGVILTLIISGTKWARFHHWKTLVKEELTRGVIRDEIGEIKFGRNAYQAVVSSKILTLPFIGKENLEPGISYRFYFLPESGIILSAEALSGMPTAEAITGLTETLAEVNGFKLSSLGANQRGELTSEQAPLLYPRLVSSLIPLMVSIAILGFLLTRQGILSALTFNFPLTYEGITGLPTSFLVLGGIMAAAVLVGLFRFLLALLDYLTRTVQQMEGVGHRQRRTSADGSGSIEQRMYYRIAGRKFKVNRRAYLSFEDGKSYRAYFTPRSKVLVNIEVVE